MSEVEFHQCNRNDKSIVAQPEFLEETILGRFILIPYFLFDKIFIKEY